MTQHACGIGFDNLRDSERRRLAAAEELFDPATFRHLERIGIRAGMRRLEVGGGTGSVARWMIVWLILVSAAVEGQEQPAQQPTLPVERKADLLLSPIDCCTAEWWRDSESRTATARLLLAGASFATLYSLSDPPRDARWDGRNSFDEGVRDGLMGTSRSMRKAADTSSDVLLYSLAVGLLVDDLFRWTEFPNIRSVRFAPDKWHSLAVDLSWTFTNLVVTEAAKVGAGRERPYVRPCRNDGNYVPDCNEGRDDHASFFSGHASWSATSAGLLCARHVNGSTADTYDWAVCGVASGASVATGLLRITAEKHYFSDVLVGWGFGALFGYVLPTWFDYAIESNPDGSRVTRELMPIVAPDRAGLAYALTF